MTDGKDSQARGCTCPEHHYAGFSRREFVRLLNLGSLALATGRISSGWGSDIAASAQVKYYGAFSELPAGAVQPRGWIQKWLERQAQGLSGHPENMAYPYDTCMYAGVIPPPSVEHGESWWPYEQSGYFFDAIARLNRLIDDPTVKQRHEQMLDYILRHSSDKGFGASVWGWPNSVVGRGLLADYSATGNPEIAALIHRYIVKQASQTLAEGLAVDDGLTHAGGVNAQLALQLYAQTGDEELLAYAQRVYERYTAADLFSSIDNINGPRPLEQHGVLAAEFLKIIPLTYLYTGNPQALDLTRRAYEKVIAESLMPDGGIASNEGLYPTAFDSVHESCDITAWAESMGYCLMATGDAKWADLIERATFNALPGAVSKDFKQAQYFSAANQILCTSLSSHAAYAPTRMSYRAAHDTECCTGNINRAMPNYVIRQWMKTTQEGLAAIFYGPSVVTTTLKGQRVTLTQETDYPFRETIRLRVQTRRPVTFALQLRIPGWCQAARISINGHEFPGEYLPGTFASVAREFKDDDSIQLTLPMPVRIEPWLQGQSVVLTRGPLVFALKIDERQVALMKDTPRVAAFLHGNLIQGFPALEFYPQSEWRYGFDASLLGQLERIKVVESAMTANPFLAGECPVHLELPLRHLPNWQSDWKAEARTSAHDKRVALQTPRQLPTVLEKQDAQTCGIATMIPYGATHLRLTTLPMLFPAT